MEDQLLIGDECSTGTSHHVVIKGLVIYERYFTACRPHHWIACFIESIYLQLHVVIKGLVTYEMVMCLNLIQVLNPVNFFRDVSPVCGGRILTSVRSRHLTNLKDHGGFKFDLIQLILPDHMTSRTVTTT